jgi:hypothetical protein
MKIQKHILSRLMALDNKEADKQLSDFANEIWNKINSTKDNDVILDNLDLLEEFIYKVPEVAIKIIKHVLDNPHPAPVKKNKFGKVEGAPYKELAMKCLGLLGRIRYISPDEVLDILTKLLRSNDSSIKNKAAEVTKHLAQFDYSLLTQTKIGYGIQRKVLDSILSWSWEDRINNFDFIEIASKELLSSSVEGTSSQSFDTLTFHFAAIQPTKFLKDLRKETIDLIFEMYQRVNNPQQKMRLIRVLEEAVRTPSNVAYKEDVSQLIAETGAYLTDIYRKILFDKQGQLACPLGIAEEIDKLLYWEQKHGLLNTKESKQLREELLANRLYKLTRLLVGDDIIFREENGWDDSDQKRASEITKLIESINKDNINRWIADINAIASEKDLIDDWKLGTFKQLFLKKLGSDYPEVAIKFLDYAFDHKTPLLDFLDSFLSGFRLGEHLGYWDQIVARVTKTQNSNLVPAILYSLVRDRDLPNSELREEDLKLLEDIVQQQNEFAFLQDQSENRILHHAVITALVNQPAEQFQKIEPLIVKEITTFPQYASIYLQTFAFGTFGHRIDFSKWSESGINQLIKMLIEAPHLDWSLQEMILELAKINIEHVLNIFSGRIALESNRKRKPKLSFDYSDRYDAIPFDMNDSLSEYVKNYKDIEEYIQPWLSKITSKWSSYNWSVGRLIDKFGISLSQVLKPLLDKGDDESLMKAVRLITPFDHKDFDAYLEIVGKTDNKEIIGHIGAQFFSTGVVSGKYGIAEAYERIAKNIEKYKSNTNPRIQKFINNLIKDLLEGAARERKRADEEEQLRKVEFES